MIFARPKRRPPSRCELNFKVCGVLFVLALTFAAATLQSGAIRFQSRFDGEGEDPAENRSQGENKRDMFGIHFYFMLE